MNRSLVELEEDEVLLYSNIFFWRICLVRTGIIIACRQDKRLQAYTDLTFLAAPAGL